MSRLTRDGTAEPVSRDQIIRHARGQRNIIFPVQLTTSRIGNPTRLIHIICDDRTYIPKDSLSDVDCAVSETETLKSTECGRCYAFFGCMGASRGGYRMARGRHYAKLSLSNAARLSFSDLCILLFCYSCSYLFVVCVFVFFFALIGAW